jgi:hypothetical protein
VAPLEWCFPSPAECEAVARSTDHQPEIKAQTACVPARAPYCLEMDGMLVCRSTPGLCQWQHDFYTDTNAATTALLTACRPWTEYRRR